MLVSKAELCFLKHVFQIQNLCPSTTLSWSKKRSGLTSCYGWNCCLLVKLVRILVQYEAVMMYLYSRIRIWPQHPILRKNWFKQNNITNTTPLHPFGLIAIHDKGRDANLELCGLFQEFLVDSTMVGNISDWSLRYLLKGGRTHWKSTFGRSFTPVAQFKTDKVTHGKAFM